MESTLRDFLKFGRRPFNEQRRQFLFAGAGAFGTLLLGKPARPAANAPRVGIVGAGFAGLSCAHRLVSRGFQVHVFEARQRVGGRVTLVRAPNGSVAEGGGEFIGLSHQVWRAYATHFKLKLTPAVQEGPVPYGLDGRALCTADVEKIAAECRALCVQLNQKAAPLNPVRPWESPHALALDGISMAEWLSAQPVSSITRRVFANQLESNAVPLEKQSLLAQLAQVKGGEFDAYWEESEAFRCNTGNASLAERLANEVGLGAVSLGTPVASIERTQRGFCINTESGLSQQFDFIVLAVPPSVWSDIKISDSLPTGLQMGRAVKNITWLKGEHVQTQRTIGAELSTEVWPSLSHGESSPFVNFSAGRRADLARSRSPEERRRVYTHELSDALQAGLADPVESTFVDWSAERFTKGGYSFPAPGQITRTGEVWETGLKHLHFAGEHTCYAFIGFMEGALRSGIRAADMIARERRG